MMNRDRIHKQRFDESVSKLKNINQRIIDAQQSIQDVEEDNDLMWDEIKTLNELVPDDKTAKGIAFLDRNAFFEEK